MRIPPLFSFIQKNFGLESRSSSQFEVPDLVTKPDYAGIRRSFKDELDMAFEEKASSLSFVKHILPDRPIMKAGIAQGIVIGGTNYIVSTQKISYDGKREILSIKTGKLPVLNHKDILIAFLKEHVDNRAEAVGVNFGFPLEPVIGPYDELDGKLTRASKEHAFQEVINQPIGDLVRKAFDKDIPVTVANDTVCLALAGDGTETGSMIAGTGFNIGIKYNERGKAVVVNLETGNFNKFEASESLKTLDARLSMPGTQLFEKVISGKYLAQVFNIKAQRLGLQIDPLATSQELSALSHENANHTANLLSRKLLERSAFLVAASLAGVYDFCLDKHLLRHDSELTIIGEGSLLWKGWQYHENIEKQLRILGLPSHAIRIKHIQNSSINGAIGLLTQ